MMVKFMTSNCVIHSKALSFPIQQQVILITMNLLLI